MEIRAARYVYRPVMFSAQRLALLAPFLLVLASCSGDDDDDTIDPRDGGPRDTGVVNVRDAGQDEPDAGTRDGGVDEPDSGIDAGTRDAGPRDGGPRDAGMCTDDLETNCDGVCADLFADDMHCGACNAACTGGDICLNGVCGPPPPTNVTSVAAHVIGPGCTVPSPNAHKVAIDPSLRMFVGMSCAGEPRVARSDDLGVTFADAQPLTIPTVERFAIHAHAPDVLYAAARTTGGTLAFVKSTDGGATWSSPRIVDAGPINTTLLGFGPHITSWRNHVFLAVTDMNQSEVRVWRNDAFELVAMTSATASGGALHFDRTLGDVLLFVDAPARIEVYRSSDLGVSFALEHTLLGLGFAADYAFAAPSTAYFACTTTFGPAPCFARIDLQTGTYAAVTVPPDVRVQNVPSGAGVDAAPDGTVYVSVLGNDQQIANGSLGIARTASAAAELGEVRLVTTSTETSLFNGSGLAYIPGSSAALVAFTSSVGASVGIEAF